MSLILRRVSAVAWMLRRPRQRFAGRMLPGSGASLASIAPRGRRLALTATLVTVLSVVVAGSASAAVTRPLITSFGSLSSPGAVAIDQSSGDVYVVDIGNERIAKYDASGNLLLYFGKGVDKTTGGDVCTAASGDTCGAGTKGTAPGEFDFGTQVQVGGTPLGFLAVDDSGGPSNGDVYVADAGDGLVSKFTPSGALVTTWGSGGQLSGSTATNGPFGGIDGITVDSAGNLIALAVPRGQSSFGPWYVFEFAQGGAFTQSLQVGGSGAAGVTDSAARAGVAVNSAGDFFMVDLDTPRPTEELTSGGLPLGFVTSPAPTSQAGAGAFTLDPATGDLYAASQFSSIDRYQFNGSGQVIEPDGSTCTVASSQTGCGATDSTSIGFSGGGIAVSAATGNTYVSNPGTGQVSLYGVATVPDVITGTSTNVQTNAATVSGTTNPDGVQVTACQFEYGTATSYGSSAPCSQSPTQIGSGSSPVPVSADLSGLQPGTTYHYRVDVSNANGTSHGSDETFETLAPPTMAGAAATDETQTAATVFSSVDPNSVDTHVHVDYGTTTAYGDSAPAAGEDIGSGSAGQQVSFVLSGLQPATVYHYRVVSISAAGTAETGDETFETQGSCPNDQYRTGMGAYLPDCRAYELVSPTDKNGAIDAFGTSPIQDTAAVAPGGNRVLLETPAAWLPNNVDPSSNLYVFTRTAPGWSPAPVRPADAPGGAHYGMIATSSAGMFSPDLSQFGVFVESDFTQGLNGPTSFEFGPAGGPFTNLGSPPGGVQGAASSFLGSSGDFSHVLFGSTDHALISAANPTGTVAGAHDLYDYTGGSLHLVNVNSDGSLTSGCGAQLGAAVNFTPDDHAVSSDGSRIFFVSPDPGASNSDPSCQAQTHLYMRLDSGAADASTLDLGPVTSRYYGQGFVDATPDGSEVLFRSTNGLTVENTVTGTSYLIATATVFEGVLSADGSTVYFTSNAQLAGAPPATFTPPGYIYRYVLGSQKLSYVGQDLEFETAPFTTDSSGRFLLFNSQNAGLSPNFPGNQLYRYDSSDGSVLCVSCRSDGSIQPGDAGMDFATIPRTFGPVPQNMMSVDGRYVFFATKDALVPRDVNPPQNVVGGQGIAIDDVYEWEAQGTGNCVDPRGCLHLLNAGSSSVTTYLLGATPDGSNVFIATHDQLVPWDTDQLGDLYDVRVDGGLPAPAAPPDCSSDCQGTSYSPPPAPAVASVNFSGSSNSFTPATTGTVKLLRKTVMGTRFVLTLQVPAGGRMTVSGAGVTSIARSVPQGGTYRLNVSLTARERRLLKRRHSLKLRLRVAYAAADGSAASVMVPVTAKA